MTIIAYKDGILAADSVSVRGGMRAPIMQPKLIRAPDGTITGSAGSGPALHEFRQWVIAGMNFTNLPAGWDKNSADDLDALILKPDGSLWRMDQKYRLYPLPRNSTCIGDNDAAVFAEGAMAAGMSAPDAVRLAIEHCVYIGGPVQVERIHPEMAGAAE